MNIIIGFLAGLSASMGLGGGFVLLIYLSAFAGVPQDIAQGVNLLFFLPIALFSVFLHIKNKLIDFKLVLKYLITALPCAVAGSIAAYYIDVGVLKRLFAVFLLVIGFHELLGKKNRSEEKQRNG